MVGAEWRKAGRVYDALQERIKSGAYVGEEGAAQALFGAWDALPSDFRNKIEARIFNKQKVSVRESVDADLTNKIAIYEQKVKDYQAASEKYNTIINESRAEQAKLEDMKLHIKYGEALQAFCKALGIGQQVKF